MWPPNRGFARLRAVGAIAGILGTACVVGHALTFGYLLWFIANGCWIAVSIQRRDRFAVAMFSAYQAATVYGLCVG
jgi:hypothetical protein